MAVSLPGRPRLSRRGESHSRCNRFVVHIPSCLQTNALRSILACYFTGATTYGRISVLRGVRSHTTTIFLQGDKGGHRQDFGLFPLGTIIPYTWVLLGLPMLSFRVRSCSLLEPEHARLTYFFSFALLDMIQYMVNPFQVRHEQPAEGAQVACHEQPGFRCPLQPVRLPAAKHTFHLRCVSQHTKSAVRVVLLMKTHSVHALQHLLF